MNKKITLTIIGSILLAIFYWFSTHAFIEVVVENPRSGHELSYSFLSSNAQKPSTNKTQNTKLRKLVSRGTHEILLNQNESSYFAVVKSGGFLSKTTIKAVLTPEKLRTFIGDNPGPCMYFIGHALASAGCNDSFDNLRLHSPTSSSQPTYLQNSNSPIIGDIEGLIKLGNDNYALIKAPDTDEDQGAPHTLYNVSDNLELSQGIPLSDLKDSTYYSMVAYGNGFVVHSDSFDQILYYSSPNASPTAVEIGRPVDQELKPYFLGAQEQSLVMAYSNNTEKETADIHDTKNRRVKTAVVMYDGKNSRQFDFKGTLSSVKLCGTSKLCVLKADKLEVYGIADSKPRLLFSVSEVSAIEQLAGNLVVARKNEVLNLDVDKQKGAIGYSLGSYKFCGIKAASESYALCLINSRSQKTALLVHQGAENQDSIDKKIAELLQMPEISRLSIYGSYIFISPALGELVYDETQGRYDYDPVVKKDVNGKIDRRVGELGIDRKSYTIINTLQ